MRPAALQKLHRAVDRRLAERVSIQPMRAGGYLAATPIGAAAEVTATIADTATSVRTSGAAASSGHNVNLIAATHTAKYTTSDLPFAAAEGFVLTRLDAPETPQFRVSAAVPLGVDRTLLMLVRVTT